YAQWWLLYVGIVIPNACTDHRLTAAQINHFQGADFSVDLARIGPGGAGSSSSLAWKSRRRGQHVLTHNGSGCSHLNAGSICRAAVKQCITPSYFGGWIVHRR